MFSFSPKKATYDINYLFYTTDEKPAGQKQLPLHPSKEGEVVDPNSLYEHELFPSSSKETTKEPKNGASKHLARFLLFASAALYGTNFSLVKILEMTGMSVGGGSSIRFFLASLVTFPWLFFQSNSRVDSSSNKNNNNHNNAHVESCCQQETQRSSMSCLLGKLKCCLCNPTSKEMQAIVGGFEIGMWNAVGYVSQAIGLESTEASKSAFFCSLAVVVVPMLDRLSGRPLLPKQILGAILAVVGVACLELDENLLSNGLSKGDIWSLVQPLAFGMGFWRTEHIMAKLPENEASRLTAAQLLAVFCGSLIYMGFQDWDEMLSSTQELLDYVSDVRTFLELVWIGVVTTAFTVYMETVALKSLSAAEATLILSTEPLWGTAFAIAIMGENIGTTDVAGAMLILAACIFSSLPVDSVVNDSCACCGTLADDSVMMAAYGSHNSDAHQMSESQTQYIRQVECV